MAMNLTKRECEIIALIAMGYTNMEIGVALWVSTETIKSHVRRILPKLEAKTRAEAVYRAIERGWLPSPNGSIQLQPGSVAPEQFLAQLSTEGYQRQRRRPK